MTELELRMQYVNAATGYYGCKENDGSHKPIIDLYNSYTPHPRGYRMTYDAPWCAAFASAMAVKCGFTDIIPVECSCSKQIELFKKLARWVENDAYVPSPGDLVYYDWDDNGVGDNTGDPEHVGIVTAVNGSVITVIEGNKNNAVDYRKLTVNGRYIRGYGVPYYASKATKAKTVDELASEVIEGKWGNGAERKQKLTAAGYDYAAVQAAVNAKLAGEKKSVEDVAKEVIQGKWGNGGERKARLAAAGYDYAAVQAMVNKLLA